MPAGACGHDDEVAHDLPPRINARLWCRHARQARFTSLRDMSLRRNRLPALRADAMVVALMRGLRA
jgi:hypothetical protein